VLKRPYVDQFLKRMSEVGQVHIFTAATKSYADPVIDMIDPNGYVTGRYYREHCKTDKNGNLIKPMDIITTNLTRLIIIDDSEIVYNMYKENTIKIP
jgi:carboxy-terminal domain RNA polymerase II polypeptide A small phosphatase